MDVDQSAPAVGAPQPAAGRGVVGEGNIADLVLFDPAEVADLATYPQPRTQAAGIRHVLVGGRATITDGQPTGDLPGRALRRSGDGRAVA